MWLKSLERRMKWLEIPHLAVILVTLQAIGFAMVMSDPQWALHLALFPQAVLAGEYWRVITFLYFIVDAIEREWGAFATTLYVLISILLTVLGSFALNMPVTQAADFESTLFLAAAALFPEMEIRLFLMIPVKMKWLGWLTLGFLGLRFAQLDWDGRLLLLALYGNYLLFFGPATLERIRLWRRRREYVRKTRR
jgi:membrane associated rhomboid family serine protease